MQKIYVKVEINEMAMFYEMFEYFRQYSENILQLSGKFIMQEHTNITMQQKILNRTSDL